MIKYFVVRFFAMSSPLGSARRTLFLALDCTGGGSTQQHGDPCSTAELAEACEVKVGGGGGVERVETCGRRWFIVRGGDGYLYFGEF